MPLEIAAKTNARLAVIVPMATMGGGDSDRPFTLKNLEAPRKFSGIKHPTVTSWLTEISRWIRLSKVLEDDLWDVVATHVIGGALTWINARMSATKELGVRPWISWQAFEKALKGQFKPLLKEERARDQIRRLV